MSTETVSSPTRARQRITGTSDQAAYINNHSVVSLLNDLLVSVVENKPDDVLTFLVDYLSQLQDDVTRARQQLERKSRGGAGDPSADPNNNNIGNNNSLTKSGNEEQEIIVTSNQTADSKPAAAAAGAVDDGRERAPSMGSQRPVALKRLIEVRVDGEVRMIPDVEDDEADDAFYSKQAESVRSVSRTQSGVACLRGVEETLPTTSASTIIVQEPTAVRFLLKAAERQKTPFLSILVDHARTKAAALSAGDLSHKSPLSTSTVISSSDAMTGQLRAPHHSVAPSRRTNGLSAPSVTSYYGIELLQRSSSGDQYPSLSILNNHWMVRRQIVIAVEENGEVSRSYSPAPPDTNNTSATTRAIDEGGLVGRTSSTPATSPASPPTSSNAPQRAILVQDPTPIRLLLKAAERQLSPNLAILTDFARKRYGTAGKDNQAAGGGGVVSNPTLFGIELLHRSHAHCNGLKALGVLSNHWMVRRQIVVAVKPKESTMPVEDAQ